MPGIDVLEPAVQLALSEPIRAALHSAVSRSDPKSRLTEASNVRDLIELSVKRTLALELRRLNATLSAQERLPIEIWSNIWELLSDADRVSVPLVCSKWREFFHGCPSLWTVLHFYTTCHAPLCKCSSCTGCLKENARDPSGWETHSYPEASTNVSVARDVLSRSRALPLNVTFHIVPFVPNPDVVDCLIEALLPHTARLHRLCLRVCRPKDASGFLARFDSLPALRVLELDAVTEGLSFTHMPNEQHFITRDLGLPVLQELHLQTPHLTWSDSQISFDHPRLRKLTVRIKDFHDLLKILPSCPGLVSLHIQLSSGAQKGSYLQDELRCLLGTMSITEVEVSDLRDAEGSDWAVKTFNPAVRPLQQFSLGFGKWFNKGMRWALLNDLGDDVHLASSRAETRLELCGTDSAGRVRRLWEIPLMGPTTHFLTRDWFWVPYDRTVSLSIDAYEWVRLVSRFPEWPRVESLTVAFWVDADIVSVPEKSAQRISFPVLRSATVSILAKDVQVTAENVIAFLRLLNLPASLEDLRIDRRVRDCDPELFSTFAKRVHIDKTDL